MTLPAAAPTAAERWAESDAALVEQLRDIILHGGPMRFDRWMATVLYDPDHGYYAAGPDRPTRDGDYLSAPELDPVFGMTLAGQVSEAWQRLGRPEPFTLREEAAGSGALGLAMLDRMVADDPPLADALRYLPIEATPAREAGVRERLVAAGHGSRLAREAARDEPMTGLVLANELLDALPVRRLTRRDGRLLELHVEWRADWFAEVAMPPSDSAAEALLDRMGVELVEGQVTEVGLASAAWIRDLGARLERGYALIIDYGLAAPERHDPVRRPAGLLRTYHRHHAGDDPYRRVGHQDLTAHVDWTALELSAADAGLAVLGRTSQAEALTGLGLGERLVEIQAAPGVTTEAYLAARAAVGRLLDPRALGGFGVLVLGRDVPVDPPLGCLAFRLQPR